MLEFGKANMIDKALRQPDKVRMVIEKVRTDGLLPTVSAIRSKLDQPIAMGYCNAGVVVGVGAGVAGFEEGDRVASNGKHAGYVCVPANLCAHIPQGVTNESAAFTVIGAIALQGIRLIQPTLGETVVVTGLGLIGLIAVQLLHAHGCNVIGIDMDPQRLAYARDAGAATIDLAAGTDPVAAIHSLSKGRGADAVIIAASTRSSEPVHQAAQMCRKRGRIVLIGVTGLELSRADFYEKELSFQVSCSYGPGRYDPEYEEKGHDYPIGFVRWTQQRNFEAVLDMLHSGRLVVTPLISHRFKIDQAAAAYAVIGGSEKSMALILEFPQGQTAYASAPAIRTVAVPQVGVRSVASEAIGFIGAGNYATAMLIPAFRKSGVRLRSIVSASGVSSVHAARKFGFEQAATDAAEVIADKTIDIAVIATRHDSHARYAKAARSAGKHVFVEKPLCLTLVDLEMLKSAWTNAGPILMVGFNRRFSALTKKMKSLLDGVPGPKAFVVTVNAGSIPTSHWTQNTEIGGGRVVGEACHFIDLLRHLVGSPIQSFAIQHLDVNPKDSLAINLKFADGSIATIHYLSNGSKAFPKERIEVFAGGRVMQLDNFRKLTAYGWPGFTSMKLWRQDKGQIACVQAFVDAVRSGSESPIPLTEILEVGRVSIELQGMS